MRFNNTTITQETIMATRRHFADSYALCIASAVEFGSIPNYLLPDDKFFVNDLEGYILALEGQIVDMLAGKCDNSFTFAQRAYWIQTGQDVALLP
jgi:hypothetical protein